MNFPPNTFNTDLSRAHADVSSVQGSVAGNQSGSSIAEQDWFSEHDLGNGALISASQFAGQTNFSNVEQAVSSIVEKLHLV